MTLQPVPTTSCEALAQSLGARLFKSYCYEEVVLVD